MYTRRATVLLWVSSFLVVFFSAMTIWAGLHVADTSMAQTLVVAFVNNLGICVGFVGAMVNYEFGGQNTIEQQAHARQDMADTKNLPVIASSNEAPK